jgi:chalcone isomerase-like protein
LKCSKSGITPTKKAHQLSALKRSLADGEVHDAEADAQKTRPRVCTPLPSLRRAQAADLGGVKVPDSMVGGQSLPLNGMAVGKKFIFKVYVVALYLPAPTKADAAVVDSDVPKGFVMQFLRSVRKEKLAEAFKEGFEKNAGQKMGMAQVQIDTASSSRTSPARVPPSRLRTRRRASRERTSPTPSSCFTLVRSRPGKT